MQRFADDTGGTAFLPKFQPIDTKDEYQSATIAERMPDPGTHISPTGQ
jgi:hypothetical protein